MSKPEQKILRSPKGTASYPHLTKPSTSFSKEGVYEVDLALDPSDPEVVQFIESIEAFRDANAPGGNSPIREHLDKDKKPTGMLSCKFRSQFRPAIFDAKRNAWPESVQIGGGSVIRCAYTLNSYEAKKDLPNGGVNCYLQGVQVLELVEYVGRDAEGMGFEEEEGYEVEPDKRGEAFDGDKTGASEAKPAKTSTAKASEPAGVPSHALDPVLKKLGLSQKVIDAEIPFKVLEEMWEKSKKSEVMFKIKVNTWINEKMKGA